jgi:RNAse (barnase) inhibitor barstar
VANLPVLPTDINGNVIVPQTIRFEDTTFKNQFTENERNKIVSKITTDKHWGLTW